MLKKIYIISFILTSVVFSQKAGKTTINGKVEYISSQFIYVNFETTDGINIGDTLFTSGKRGNIPQLIVKSKSSRSCATVSIKQKFQKGDEVFALVNIKSEEKITKKESENNLILSNEPDEVKIKQSKVNSRFTNNKRDFYGRFNVSGYSSLSNENDFQNYMKWRYSLSLNADRINGSGFSLSSYVIFRYRADEWNYTSSHLSDAAKIYDLAVKYDYKNTNFIFGRKINNKIANIGAIDGLQVETNINTLSIGGVIGSRPNFSDYGYNLNLFQMGAYVNKTDSLGKGVMQNTVSLFQQMNHGSTDRRFVYLQHSNNVFSNMNFFLSSEVDLFKRANNKPASDLRLTSLYLSARYSPARWISASASYDARRNVIYYETFKNYVDQLIETASRQGFRLSFNIRPMNYVFINLNSGYRFSNSDIKPTKNYGISITHSRIPFLNLSANVNYLGLNTSYISGNVFGLRFSKDLLDGLLYASLGYRNVDYSFINNDNKLLQNIYQLDLSFSINRSLSLSLSFEGTYQGKTSYSNVYTNFSWRF